MLHPLALARTGRATDYLPLLLSALTNLSPASSTTTTHHTMKFTAVILALCAMCASAFIAPSAVGESSFHGHILSCQNVTKPQTPSCVHRQFMHAQLGRAPSACLVHPREKEGGCWRTLVDSVFP